MFADYRVPQILLAHHVLHYSPPLQEKITQGVVLPPGSEEEVEIRAATVQAVESLKEEISRSSSSGGGGRIIAVVLDWLLWQEGEKLKDEIPPHHRTLTIYY